MLALLLWEIFLHLGTNKLLGCTARLVFSNCILVQSGNGCLCAGWWDNVLWFKAARSVSTGTAAASLGAQCSGPDAPSQPPESLQRV